MSEQQQPRTEQPKLSAALQGMVAWLTMPQAYAMIMWENIVQAQSRCKLSVQHKCA